MSDEKFLVKRLPPPPKLCFCDYWIERMEYDEVAVTFECAIHGKIVLDYRMVFTATIRPQIERSPNLQKHFEGKPGIVKKSGGCVVKRWTDQGR